MLPVPPVCLPRLFYPLPPPLIPFHFPVPEGTETTRKILSFSSQNTGFTLFTLKIIFDKLDYSVARSPIGRDKFKS
jgi:hypothetical protein